MYRLNNLEIIWYMYLSNNFYFFKKIYINKKIYKNTYDNFKQLFKAAYQTSPCPSIYFNNNTVIVHLLTIGRKICNSTLCTAHLHWTSEEKIAECSVIGTAT